MGVIRSFQGVQGTIGQPTAQVIDGSLRFNGTSHYLSRGFGSGNRRTFTLSCWVKTHHGSDQNDAHHSIFSVGSTKDNIFNFAFQQTATGSGSLFTFERTTSGGEVTHINTVASGALRDSSAWYHFVLQFDTTRSVSADRIRMYINGELKSTGSGTIPSENYQSAYVNTSTTHQIGRFIDNFQWYGDYSLAQYYFIDGLALGPGYFGFTDPLTNTWRPKKFRAEGTTVNDGTVWSESLTGARTDTNEKDKAFDGSLTTKAGTSGSGASAQLTFTSPKIIHFNSSVRVYVYWGSANDVTMRLDGGAPITVPGNTWTTLVEGTGSFKTLTVNGVSNSAELSAIEVDGVIMQDSTTTNLDFGTNGFYLPMDNQDDFEVDKSGKGNNWTKNNFSGTSINPDVLKDSPSGAVFGGRGQTGITTTSSAPSNYCTWNPLTLYAGANYTLSEGNLKAVKSGGNVVSLNGTIGVSFGDGGKFYYEADHNSSPTQGQGIGWGNDQYFTYTYGTGFRRRLFYKNTTVTYSEHDVSGTNIATGLTSNFGKTLGVAFDLDENTMSFYVDGVLQATATGVWGTYFDTTDTLFPFLLGDGTNNNGTVETNFGQKPFKYAPPQGYLPLNSASVRPNKVIPRPDQYVGVTTYSGDNGEYRVLPLNHQPDFTWFKERGNIRSHILSDTVTGITKHLSTDDTAAQTSPSYPYVSSVDERGIVLRGGTSSGGNVSGRYYVAWTWKAGGNKNTFNLDDIGYATAAAAGLDSGSNTVIGASVGTKQGFSIIKYTGDAGSDTVSHGLTQPPDLLLVKQLNNAGTESWHVMHSALGATYRGKLDTNAAFGNTDDGFGNVDPTSSVFTVAYNGTNKSGSDYIAYCWHNVPGLQKFGKYVGNNNADGPYVELGFRPALLWVKRTDSTGNWVILDTKREPFNPVDTSLYADTNEADYTPGQDWADLLSNGFKIRATYGEVNASSGDYIYCAWAEAPASNLFGGQSNAR